jgi:hypothetical protein
LIRLLPGISQGSNQPLTFSFDSVNGRIMNFKAADGSPLRFDCFGATIAQPPRDCTFHVSGGGIVDANSFPQDVPGVRFRFKDGGQELEFTCQSAQCKVESSTPAAVSRVLKVRESNVIPTSSPATFTVSP